MFSIKIPTKTYEEERKKLTGRMDFRKSYEMKGFFDLMKTQSNDDNAVGVFTFFFPFVLRFFRSYIVKQLRNNTSRKTTHFVALVQ